MARISRRVPSDHFRRRPNGSRMIRLSIAVLTEVVIMKRELFSCTDVPNPRTDEYKDGLGLVPNG
ncbi:hypothetical protein OIDMADRAFT_18923 [Oidiodendron maius Zn]|uniref:Uncharacterized protein n=1 Tax=Oidiodendron maius (strain Zn) TaxID=913774 RepID=A0A0C3H2D3_OIDMZ|nr:hypothetical protein OIDMADRAFT_18923 [Oidiodendron maius Zn]